MWGSWISRLLAAAAVALSMSCGQVAAQEGGGSDSIVVTLPADLDAAERRALIDALAALGRPVSGPGRPSGRGRVCQYGEITVVAGTIKKKKHKQATDTQHG